MKSRLKAQENQAKTMWLQSVSLLTVSELSISTTFRTTWHKLMTECCHKHPVSNWPFIKALREGTISEKERFALASVWSVNMVVIHTAFHARGGACRATRLRTRIYCMGTGLAEDYITEELEGLREQDCNAQYFFDSVLPQKNPKKPLTEMKHLFIIKNAHFS